MAYFDKTGFNIEGYASIYERLADRLASKINPLLPIGEVVDTSDTSIFGRLIALIAEPLSQQDELLQQVVLSKDIDSAEGNDLDDIVRLGNVYRLPATPASAYLIVYGDIGTFINVGNTVTSRTSGDTFSLIESTTFSQSQAFGVEYSIDSFVAGDVFTLSYIADGLLNEYVPITVMATSLDTPTSICEKLALQTTILSSVITAVNDGERITFKFIDENFTGTFTPSANLIAERSYMGVNSESVTLSDISLPENTITSISSSVLGWRGVYNPFPTIAALPNESDVDLRARYKNTLGFQVGNEEAMLGGISALPSVRYVKIQENSITSVTPDGRSGNGIAVVVLGGNSTQIASTIYKYNSTGCLTDGDITEVISDINGGTHEIKFSRPNTKEIEIVMQLIVYPNFPNNGADLIRQKIVEYFDTLGVGDQVALSRLYTPINSIDGFAITNMKARVKGSGSYLTDVVPISYNEIAAISYSDISFGGS